MKRPTMDDVAHEAGVSRALVSLVMRESPKVSENSREAVLVAAEKLGYRPNVMARNLAARRTKTIGLLLNDLHNPYFAEIADGIRSVAEESGYRLLLGAGWNDDRHEAKTVESFLEYRVDGMILTGARLAARAIENAAGQVPVVSVGRQVRSARVDSVVVDEHEGASLAVRHLVELGHRHIVHVDGGRGAGAIGRRAGYESAMAALGLEDEIRIIAGEQTESAGAAGVAKILAAGELPTAIFTANDLSAVGALDRIVDAGLDVPGDVSLVGFDNTTLAALGHISLTTIDQPLETMGRLAIEALLARLDDSSVAAQRHVVAPTLVVRSSTAAPRS